MLLARYCKNSTATLSSSVLHSIMQTTATTATRTAMSSRSTLIRALSSSTSTDTDAAAGATTHIHFRATAVPHPLNAKPSLPVNNDDSEQLGDHTGRQQNHIWTPSELQEKMSTLYHHEPKTLADKVMNKLMFTLYHSFNFITGYTPVNPSVQAMQWRLIVLESIAGVPGFVAAGFRHFRSLRKLQRDHGWIATLLEEAENERMHLLICLSTFNATPVTRSLVIAAQYLMTPFLMSVYFFNPKAMHRFVGYLEETGKFIVYDGMCRIMLTSLSMHLFLS